MQDPDTCAGFRIQVNALLDNFHKAPPDRMTPAALMDLSAFHARMAQKCVDAANAKCEPADSGIRKQGLSHIVWAEQIAAHAQNLQA